MQSNTNKQLNLIFLIGFTLLLYSSNVFANSLDYYADIEIDVTERGDVVITGITNNPDILGTFQDLTSKQGKYWVFNLSSDYFSSALYKITFPINAQITYIKSTAQLNIGSDGTGPSIKGILSNKPLEIVVQYYFEDVEDENNSLMFLFIAFGSSFFIFGFFLLHHSRKKRFKEMFVLSSLNQRQRDIVLLLKKKDGVTQKYLEEHLNLPKSSISRNVASLERKEIIVKVSKGYSNTLFLNNK